MADYYSVLSRAIESLRPNTAETRRVLYERAEQTLLAQLRALDPPASEDQIQAQTKSLTDAIARIEAEHAVTEALTTPEPETTDTGTVDSAPEAEAKTEPETAETPAADDASGADSGDAPKQSDEDDTAASPDKSAMSDETNDTKAETPSVTPPPPAPAWPRASSLPDPAPLEVKRTPTVGTPTSTADTEAGSDQPEPSDKTPAVSGAQRPASPFGTAPRLSTERPSLSVSAEDRTVRNEGDRVEPSLGTAARPSLSATDAFQRGAGRPGSLAGDAPSPKTDAPRIGEPRIGAPKIGDAQADAPEADADTTDEIKTGAATAGEGLSGGASDETQPSDPFVEDSGGRRRGGGWGLLLVLLIVVGIIGGGVYWFRGPILDWSEAILEMISAPGTEDASDKIEDRLNGEGEETAADDTSDTTDTAEDTTGTDTDIGETPTTPDVLENGVAEAQLIEQNEDEPNSPDRTPGTVRWQTEGSGDQLELVGSVDVPGRGLAMSMRVAKNTDETFPATHTIIFQFSLSPDFEHGGVQDVPRLLLKQTAQSSGNALVTDVIPLDQNAFLMALSGVDLDAERNLTELKSRPFLDVPLIYTDGRLAILTIAKGAQGDRAFADAFAAWGQ